MIRRWRRTDAEASYAVYVDAVRNGTAEHYTRAQRRAWVPSEAIEQWWAPRLEAADAWVAEDKSGLTGVISLRRDGHLDLFFVRPRARGDGTAVALYAMLLAEARTNRHERLTTHASLYLRPFLERRGWQVTDTEDTVRFGVPMRRFAMELRNV